MDHERYTLLDVIGSGGMATVWRARDTRLGRVVALKRPHPAPPGSPALMRFAREARAAATVSHPHLVAVYDAGDDGVGPYLVMELVDGPSLAHATPTDGVAALGAQVASALAALHAAGVVHGDVKPANILLSGDGAKLTDFGIARTVDETSTLTEPGIALGTPAYAAPETLATGVRDKGADVYSLAAVLHELVTGTRWNPGDGSTQVLPPTAWRSVLARALSAEPTLRPTSEEFAAELAGLALLGDRDSPTVPIAAGARAPDVVGERTVDSSTRPSPTSRHSPARRRQVVAALLVLAVLGVLGALVWFESRAGDGVVTAVTDPSAATAANDPSAATAASDPSAAGTIATVPTTTTVPATSPPVATSPSVGASPATIPPMSPVDRLAGELRVLIDGAAPKDLKPKEARDINDRIDAAVSAAASGDPKKAGKELSAAADGIQRHLADDQQDAAADLIAELAAALGIDP